MMEKNRDEYHFSDAFSTLLMYITHLRSKWVYIVLVALVTAALGAGYYAIQKPKYEAACTFILEERQSGLGGLSGLASQFGFDIGGMSGGSLFAGDNILEILKSNTIIREVLLSQVDSSSNKKLIDLFIEFNGWRNSWKDNDRLSGINYYDVKSPLQPLTLQQDSILGLARMVLVKKSITVERLIKKGSLIKVTIKSPSEVFAKTMSERMILMAREMYVLIKTRNASASVHRLEQKADSLLRLLNAKTFQTAHSVVVDANPALRTVAVPAELNVRDKMVLQTLYAEVVKNLEVSRIALMQQTPVIQVLDAPNYPLVDKSKGLLFLIVVGFFLGLVISSFVFMALFILKDTRLHKG